MFDRSFYSCVRRIVTGREHVRVAVIGAKESGKTVFLTALENHLRNHDGRLLNLDGWSVVCLEDEGGAESGFPRFQYAKARCQLGDGEWPDNTTAVSVVRLKLRLEKSRERGVARRTVVLELLDLPGERVADLSMVGRSFREWSEWMEDRFGGGSGVSPHYSDYLRRIESASDADAIISAYKDCVLGQYGEGVLTIAPSILKLGVDGVFRVGRNRGEFEANLKSAFVGLGADSQFAPLPKSYFTDGDAGRRAVVRAFERAYCAYRAKVVSPIADWLSHANKAVYLVDVLGLLRDGPVAYNAEQNFADRALQIFRRDGSDNPVLDGVRRFLGAFVRTHADGVYVVATKSDTVVGEKNRSRMVGLARAMMKPTLSRLGLPENRVGVCSCASVLTTEEFVEEGALEARIEVGRDDAGKPVVERRQYLVSDVPIGWPDDGSWSRGGEAYDFRPTFPMVDRKLDRPQRQLGLDFLVRKLLSLSEGE